MSKTTKFIAALGVVAGIGVASLPLTSYAEGETSVSGNVKVEVEITPAIAMKIHSNADDYSYSPVTPAGSENPSEEGWYVEADGVYSLSEDTSVQSGTTYYTRSANNYGFIGYEPVDAQGPSDSNPVAGPSQATGLQLSANQADETTLFSEIEVRSNTGAYSLTLLDADNDTRLNLATVSTTTNEYIPAGVTTKESGGSTVIDGTVAGWAVKGGLVTNWTAVPAGASSDYNAEEGTGTAAQTPLTILSAGTNPTAPSLDYGAKTKVNYGIASGLTKTGIYSDIITYTATAIDAPAAANPGE